MNWFVAVMQNTKGRAIMCLLFVLRLLLLSVISFLLMLEVILVLFLFLGHILQTEHTDCDSSREKSSSVSMAEIQEQQSRYRKSSKWPIYRRTTVVLKWIQPANVFSFLMAATQRSLQPRHRWHQQASSGNGGKN